ncbi:MAG: hypothetical protein H7Y04_16805 [Verrucomicrobia bacterium]|nr:hypothetical protein [Cytophagales bacterium]
MTHRNFILPLLSLLSLTIISSCSKTDSNPAPTTTTEDILASDDNAKLGDVEFDAINKRICWQSIDDNKLWVCNIDPATGKLVIGSGKQTEIDNSIVPLTTSFNSGEWAFSQAGTAIVYNKSSVGTFYVAIATETNGIWSSNILTTSPNRLNPRATKNPNDAVAAVQYATYPGSGSTKYKKFNALSTELSVSDFKDAHWAEDEQLLTGILPNNQVGLFNPANPTTPIQITSNTSTVYSRPYMWRAPEQGNARMFFAKANGNQIQVFKEATPGSNNYVLYLQFNCPSANYPNIASPEPVVFNGKSYISFMAAESQLETSGKPAEIWLATIDSVNPVYKMVSDNTTRVRTDPEPYISDNQLYIYYTEVDDSAAPDFAIDVTTILKLRRCKTGL